MQLEDLRKDVREKKIARVTVFRVPIKDKPANGYQYKIVFDQRSGDRDFLTRQRGGARTFAKLGAVERILLDVGIRFYSVIMLEYQVTSDSFKKMTHEGYDGYFCPA